MTLIAPRFKIQIAEGEKIQTPAEVVNHVKGALEDLGLHGQEGGAGCALVYLFGRLAELIINRLNQVPDKHFLAFLNEAGVDLLPPRPANTELTFIPGEDGPALIRVPAGTQVATVQTETQPEVIFETQQDMVVSPNTLVKCIAFDPMNYSDCTSQATGQKSGSTSATLSTSFAAFEGGKQRERILYMGDDELFTFSDDASREAAMITLTFGLAIPGNSAADGWELKWLYWDGSIWADLEDTQSTVTDNTNSFSIDGSVLLANLPELTEAEVDGESGLWISCKLIDGTARKHLPVLSSITVSRTIDITSTEGTADACLTAIQSGTTWVPFDPTSEFFPLGQRPTRLDTFYLQADEAFTKQGAIVKLHVDLVGVTETPADTSELNALELVWEYYSDTDGWTELGVSKWQTVASTRLSFEDTTLALTANGDNKHVSFKVPQEGGSDPVFAKTKVNDQEGYWVRARVAAGSYDVPGKMEEQEDKTQKWIAPKTYAPLIKELKVEYTDYTATAIGPRTIASCLSRVDGTARNHKAALAAQENFSPFSAAEEEPALYLGFQQAFPAGEWVQLLLDVEEEKGAPGTSPIIFWEYWNGKWNVLRAADGSRGLSVRGYLGFFGPDDHRPGFEFGQIAYWLRARPHVLPPVADAGDYPPVSATDDEAVISLDASGSEAFNGQTISRYMWRLVNSSPPVANAGSDRTVTTPGEQATVHLDASGSQPAEKRPITQYIWRLVSSRPLVADAGPDQTVTTLGKEATVHLDASDSRSFAARPIFKYIWRRAEPEEQEERPAITMPYLKVIRTNTVPALNAVTITEEVLGSGDGKADQVFSLLRSPVLPGAQIAVQEPDRPPDEELKQLQKELQQVDETAQALLTPEAVPGEGAWVRWHQVSNFHSSTPASRHFTLDPITCQVGFGDGKRGKIPPVGRDNIKAVFYRTHDGAKGNAAAGTITVLRNPSGDLANIKTVTNPEAAAGGSGAGTVGEAKKRGPQSLKHRQRAVTVEDFVWLAREASGEVAEVRCLPTRNPLGLPQPGWVTAVITPKTTDAKPTPGPVLLRRVQNYLENHALTNLEQVDQIYVKGPEYIEATVLAEVVPREPEKADEVELAILEQLETFLHPLQGGPERMGWELGRNVYLSEVYAEIEAVSGVDYVVGLRLLGSLQQYRLHLREEQGENKRYREVPFDLPIDSQVSTFDERIRLLLAEPMLTSKDETEELKSLAVYGFKVGDQVTIVKDDNSVLKDNLKVAALFDDTVIFDQPFDTPTEWNLRDALVSLDQRLRLPLKKDGVTETSDGKVTAVAVQGFQANDKDLCVVVGIRRDPVLEFLTVKQVAPCDDRIFVPEGHLIYSGSHDIEMVLE